MPNGNDEGVRDSGGSHLRLPRTLLAGLGLILTSEVLLSIDLMLRGGAVLPSQVLPQPQGLLGWVARQAAVNMTALCWVGVLLVLDGFLTLLGQRHSAINGSPARLRPRRFFFCFFVSIPIWLSFDWINFSFLNAWQYHGLAESILYRYTGYFFAFGAICPALFLFAQVYQDLGFERLVGRQFVVGRKLEVLAFSLGVLFLAYPLAAHNPSGTITLWLAWFLILDPINRRLGAPSLLADWAAGRWGRTVSLMAAGATCGVLWEFWNYWAAAKWTYDLAFLGGLEDIRFFEMPAVGLAGFAPFSLECWVMFQTIVVLLDRIGLPVAEPLWDARTVI